MLEQRWLRALTLMLLGMGIFFLYVALLALLVWLTVGNWQSFLTELALVAALVSIPTAYYTWRTLIVRSL